MSTRGLCQWCAISNMQENGVQLAHHRGPYFDHWRRRMAASVGGAIIDDLRERA